MDFLPSEVDVGALQDRSFAYCDLVTISMVLAAMQHGNTWNALDVADIAEAAIKYRNPKPIVKHWMTPLLVLDEQAKLNCGLYSKVLTGIHLMLRAQRLEICTTELTGMHGLTVKPTAFMLEELSKKLKNPA